VRRARRKVCQHFIEVADVAQRVVDGKVPPSDLGTTVLAEEYLMLHLEFQALLTHLDDEGGS